MIVLTVHGTPAPQGSKTKMPNGAMLEAGSATGRQKVKDWRGDVRRAAEDWREQYGVTDLLTGPVVLTCAFVFQRPKSRRKEVMVATKPDLSKLVRSTEDALTGVVWHDDCLVVELHTSKQYANEGELPGATILIENWNIDKHT